MSAPTEFWIGCRTCDGDGPHGWVGLPTQATRGRWAAEHKAETGHDSWRVHDGTLGALTARQERKIGELAEQIRDLLDQFIANERRTP